MDDSEQTSTIRPNLATWDNACFSDDTSDSVWFLVLLPSIRMRKLLKSNACYNPTR